MMKTINKACKGCRIMDRCDIVALQSRYYTICPCTNCLIKMVCKEDVCKPYGKLIRKVYTDKRFINQMSIKGRSIKVADIRTILRE